MKLPTKYILIILLFAIHLLPIWVFKFVPTQDGINHVYNASILKDYHKPENHKLREVFQLNLKFFPNWTSHALLALLMYVFPPLICEKILISLCIVLLPISLFYFLDAVDKGRVVFSLLGFIYAYSYLLHLGFYNFVLSMSMFFFALGYWWEHKDAMRLANILVLYGLLLGTYLCHYLSYFLVVLSLSFLALFSSFRKLKSLLLFLLFMFPAYFIMLSYYLDSTHGREPEYKNLDELVKYFFDMGSLVSFLDSQILIGRSLLYFFALILLVVLWHRIKAIFTWQRAVKSGDINSFVSEEQFWIRTINGKEQFLLLAVIFTILYFKAPWRFPWGGEWINDRIYIYIFLVLLPFLNINFHRHIRNAAAAGIIIISLWSLSSNAYVYYYLNKDIAQMILGADMIEKHTTLTVYRDEWPGGSDSLGEMKYVYPFLHLPSYFCLNKDVAYLKNFEALYNYFPVNFKNWREHYLTQEADYLLVWRPEFEETREKLQDGYILVYAGGYNKLYRRKRVGNEGEP